MQRKYPKRNIVIPPGEVFTLLAFGVRPELKCQNFIQQFEDGFRKLVGTREAIAVSSGRFALYLILKSLGLEKADKVLLSAYNFIGVPQTILQDGFYPDFVDADPHTYQMDTGLIISRIGSRTKALIATHLFGQLADISQLAPLARKQNLFLIEDAAQALGSRLNNTAAGTMADAGFFSFTGSKLLNTSFGGMIVTNNTDLASKIRTSLSRYPFQGAHTFFLNRLKTYVYAITTQQHVYGALVYPISRILNLCGIDLFEAYKKFDRAVAPYPRKRLNNMQAWTGFKQLDQIEKHIFARKTAAGALIRSLDPDISLQQNPADAEPGYFMIPLKTKNKHLVYRRLLARGIDTNLHYASDCSALTGSRNPRARDLARSIITLNLPVDMHNRDIKFIADAVNSVKDLLL